MTEVELVNFHSPNLLAHGEFTLACARFMPPEQRAEVLLPVALAYSQLLLRMVTDS